MNDKTACQLCSRDLTAVCGADVKTLDCGFHSRHAECFSIARLCCGKCNSVFGDAGVAIKNQAEYLRSMIKSVAKTEAQILGDGPIKFEVSPSVDRVPQGQVTTVDIVATVAAPDCDGVPRHTPSSIIIAINCSQRFNDPDLRNHMVTAACTAVESLDESDLVHVACFSDGDVVQFCSSNQGGVDSVTFSSKSSIVDAIYKTTGTGTVKTGDIISYCSETVTRTSAVRRNRGIILVTDCADMMFAAKPADYTTPLHVICIDSISAAGGSLSEVAELSGGSFARVVAGAVSDTTAASEAARAAVRNITTNVATDVTLALNRGSLFDVRNITITTRHRVFGNGVTPADTRGTAPLLAHISSDGTSCNGTVYIPTMHIGERVDVVFTVTGIVTESSDLEFNFGSVCLKYNDHNSKSYPEAHTINVRASASVSLALDNSVVYNHAIVKKVIVLKHRAMFEYLTTLAEWGGAPCSAIEDFKAIIDKLKKYIDLADYRCLSERICEVQKYTWYQQRSMRERGVIGGGGGATTSAAAGVASEPPVCRPSMFSDAI